MAHPTVREILSHSAARSPNKVALRDPELDETVSFSSWDEQVTRVANGLLDLGLSPGDHFSVVMKDSIELVTLLFAAAEIGVVCNPISYRAPAGRISYILEHAESEALAYDRHALETLSRLENYPGVLFGPENLDEESTYRPYDEVQRADPTTPDVSVSEDDPCLLLYTSGTTGKPKGVRHVHRNVVSSNLMCLPYNRLRPSDMNVALGPLYHVGPLLANFMPALHVGATNLILPDFDPETTLEYVESEGISSIWGVPTHFNAMVNSPSIRDRDVSGVRMIQYSGSAMPREVVQQSQRHFSGVDFVNAYGTTEIVYGTIIYPEEHDERLGSIGRAVPNAEVRLVDPDDPTPENVVATDETGEILVDTPTRMLDYWKEPEKTERAVVDGWYRTGDLGRRDEEGFIYFVDRKDSMIVSGGENIYPAAVENVLHAHSNVESAAVVGTPDEEWGKVVTAFVVPTDPSLSEDDLDEFVRSSDDLEDFKRPRIYHFRDELPKTQSGKIARSALEEEVSE